MLNCCTKCCNPFNLGCVSTCARLRIGYAVTAGEYTLLTEFAGRVVPIKQTFETGEFLSFPLAGLNDSYTYCAKVIRPDGTAISFERDGICYDGFTFTTNVGVCDDNVITLFTLCTL